MPVRCPALPIGEATHNVLALKYLDGGHGDGCNDEDDRVLPTRAAGSIT